MRTDLPAAFLNIFPMTFAMAPLVAIPGPHTDGTRSPRLDD
jgi:hypothetical protein